MFTEKPPAGAAALDVNVSVETLAGESFSAARLAATETVGVGGAVKPSVVLPETRRTGAPCVRSSTQQIGVLAANVADAVKGTVPSVPAVGVGHVPPKSTQFMRMKVLAPVHPANIPAAGLFAGCEFPGGLA